MDENSIVCPNWPAIYSNRHIFEQWWYMIVIYITFVLMIKDVGLCVLCW